MQIISVQVPVKEKVSDVFIEWKRGDQVDKTRGMVTLTPDCPSASFEDVFKKLSVFYKDEKKGTYFPKKVSNLRNPNRFPNRCNSESKLS